MVGGKAGEFVMIVSALDIWPQYIFTPWIDRRRNRHGASRSTSGKGSTFGMGVGEDYDILYYPINL